MPPETIHDIDHAHTVAAKQLSNVHENTTVVRPPDPWLVPPILLLDTESVVSACGTPLIVVAIAGLPAGADSVFAA